MRRFQLTPLLLLTALSAAGCQSPYHADQGALAGGLIGTGVGAVIGNQSGHSAEGALVGAAVGALSGGAIGSAIDEAEARNRALIAAQLGRAVPPGAVHLGEVITMTQSGVSDALIVTHVQNNGLAAPLGSQDVISLTSAGVSDTVISAMQQTGVLTAADVPPPGPPAAPVVVEEHRYGWGPYPYARYPFRRWGHHHRPGWSVGVGYSN